MEGGERWWKYSGYVPLCWRGSFGKLIGAKKFIFPLFILINVVPVLRSVKLNKGQTVQWENCFLYNVFESIVLVLYLKTFGLIHNPWHNREPRVLWHSNGLLIMLLILIYCNSLFNLHLVFSLYKIHLGTVCATLTDTIVIPVLQQQTCNMNIWKWMDYLDILFSATIWLTLQNTVCDIDLSRSPYSQGCWGNKETSTV